jgi:hypothetical protein
MVGTHGRAGSRRFLEANYDLALGETPKRAVLGHRRRLMTTVRFTRSSGHAEIWRCGEGAHPKG